MKLCKTYLFSIVLIAVFYGCNNSSGKTSINVSYSSDLFQFHKNVLEYYINQKTDDAKIQGLLSDFQEDGSWSNIDYTNKIRGGWPVKNHLKYVQTLAINYKNETSKYYLDKNLSKKIHKSLNFWLDNDFLSTNWHDQHIGVPELLLPILFLMEEELSQQQLDKSSILLHRAKIKMSGQNKVWLSTNVMLRSLLLRKPDSVAIASKAIQNELQIAKGVGVKLDWSYHEHGAQMQFGNYGLSYLEDMIKCYTFVSNTPFKFEANKIEFLRNIILKGQQWVIWNDTYDVSASGRQLFENEQIKKANRLKACIQSMKMLDKDNVKVYNEALDAKTLAGNKHFWKSDFQVHRRKNFYFSVKMSSERVVGTESVNQENIQGYYMGDGVSLISTHGKEYENIFPFWDWKKLSGTTIIQDKDPLPIIKFSGFKTNSVFVGGVSNGENGIAVMDYNRDGLKAKKSWFMFDDAIVCLGSGISTNANHQVTTSINQSFLKGGVVIGKDGALETSVRRKRGIIPDWVLHDNIGYLFPDGGNASISTQILEGSWNKVAKRYRPVILTEHIFKLWLSHGNQPKNGSYSYILVPNASEEKMMSLYKSNPFKIMNTKVQQSVVMTDEKKAGIVFYKKGTATIKGGVSVDAPCVILLEEQSDHLDFAISDPSQKLTKIGVSIKGNYSIENSNYNNGKTHFVIHLPKGEQAGKTVQLQLKRN
ncbi:polysaccharide lyase family 8 super-sandwich domain-containing protein [uncultured Algibacter sp.]|uniref:polysaccharide lyase family 8 super-sandwich domain-containing protein n=1 Tax=uncultured Algibacter sp. TaxID=298659 RepID=UPI0026352F4B|nr:polysaccharide lyase family 8 super-sandwich domain-containing protein [uncultured Algibacter sp.]